MTKNKWIRMSVCCADELCSSFTHANLITQSYDTYLFFLLAQINLILFSYSFFNIQQIYSDLVKCKFWIDHSCNAVLITEVMTFSCCTECLCGHGTCNAGPRGDGSCQCHPGYQGVYCDQGMYAYSNKLFFLSHKTVTKELDWVLKLDLVEAEFTFFFPEMVI